MKSMFVATVVALTIACLGDALLFEATGPVTVESSAAGVEAAASAVDSHLYRGLRSLDGAGVASLRDFRRPRAAELQQASATTE